MWNWNWPLYGVRPEIPRSPHPGSFGAIRKYDVHTGVDLYAPEHTEVVAVESGTVVAVVPFTGEAAGSPWWRETSAVLVEGRTGVVCYGEVLPFVQPGDVVLARSSIGTVKRVLFEEPRADVPGHSSSMLHLEFYARTVREPVWWKLGEPQPIGLWDPTQALFQARHPGS